VGLQAPESQFLSEEVIEIFFFLLSFTTASTTSTHHENERERQIYILNVIFYNA
jgi:hypothetical protein